MQNETKYFNAILIEFFKNDLYREYDEYIFEKILSKYMWS